MLTVEDIKKLTEVFATKQELRELEERLVSKEEFRDLVTKVDFLVGEIKIMRQEMMFLSSRMNRYEQQPKKPKKSN